MPETEIDIEKRNKYGMLCGIVGIFLNLILFAGKLFAGMLSGAISITADAFNNLSDAGSSIITIAGFKMAAQRADEEHPYGHARMEYVATLAVAAIILIMGFELFRDSFGKIIKAAGHRVFMAYCSDTTGINSRKMRHGGIQFLFFKKSLIHQHSKRQAGTVCQTVSLHL